jgi:hypothetical protein
MRYYDGSMSNFNPYSRGPKSGHILWKNEVSAGGIAGGPWCSMSYGAGGGSPPTIMLGSVYYNMPGGVFRRQDIRTGEILWEKPGSISHGQHLIAETRIPPEALLKLRLQALYHTYGVLVLIGRCMMQ